MQDVWQTWALSVRNEDNQYPRATVILSHAEAGRRAHIRTYGHAYMHTDKQTDRETDRQTERQTDKQTDRHTDKQTNKQTNHTHKYDAADEPTREEDGLNSRL